MKYKTVLRAALVCITFALPLSATASGVLPNANCGEGYISHITEGGWGNDRIYIRLDHTVEAASTKWNFDFIRFSDQLSDSRQQSIRALAYLAIANGNKVGLHSGTGDCRNATELVIYSKNPNS